jgi:serine/threonine protein kinase
VYLAVRAPRKAAAPQPAELGRLEALWREEGPDAAIAEIERLLPERDEEFLCAALRRIADEASPLGAFAVLHSLTHEAEKVRRYAQKAITVIGWPQLTDEIKRIAGSSDPTRIDVALNGLNALAAHADPLAVLEALVDVRMPPAQQQRAIEIANNKRLRLREQDVAALFREMKSRYRIVKALGQGTVTSFYLAKHERLQSDVVVRVLQARYADDLDVRSRFLEVCSWSAGFRAGSVMRTIDLEVQSERKMYYAVRDYVDGLTLRDILAAGDRFALDKSLRVLRKLTEALEDVHQSKSDRGHAGVKPSNVYVTRDQRIVLGDPAVLPSTQFHLGTRVAYDAQYMAPEAVTGQAGPAADLYSLGCVAYQLLTGKPPFVGNSYMDVLFQHANKLPAKPSEHGSVGGERVDRFVLRLLEKDPAKRFASATEVLEALDLLNSPTPDNPGSPMPPAVKRPEPNAVVEPSTVEPKDCTLSIVDVRRFDQIDAQKSGVDLGNPANYTVAPQPSESDTSSPRRFAPGERIGHYVIQRQIGSGGMGQVFLAIDERLGRQVAIKFLLQVGPMQIARLKQEAKATAHLHHPSICTIYDVQFHDDISYIVMPYIEGKTLSTILKSGPLPISEAIRIVVEICSAMSVAHEAGIIHRDLKPANIILQPNGVPMVMDFGAARQSDDEEGSRLTQDGQILGTLAYMPPEQLNGVMTQISARSDVYALGVTLYEMIARLPFDGKPALIIMKILKGETTPPSRWRAEIGRDLDAICLKAIQRRTTDRYASMEEFAQDLKSYLDGRPVFAALQPARNSDLPSLSSAASQLSPKRDDPNSKPSPTFDGPNPNRPATRTWLQRIASLWRGNSK